jgi:hypothetical protein
MKKPEPEELDELPDDTDDFPTLCQHWAANPNLSPPEELDSVDYSPRILAELDAEETEALLKEEREMLKRVREMREKEMLKKENRNPPPTKMRN